ERAEAPERARAALGLVHDEDRPVDRLAVGERGRDDGDPYAAAELAGQVVEARARGDLVLGQVAQRGEAERQEHADAAQAAKEERPEEAPGARVRVDLGEPERGRDRDERAGTDQEARVHAPS